MLGRLCVTIDRVTTAVGQSVAWLALAMAMVQLALVLMRYVFGVGAIWLQESLWWMNGILFTAAAGYTLARDGHVRVDIIYRAASRRRRAWIDLVGAVVLLLPFCAALLWTGWPYVAASWAAGEGSRQFGGIPRLYLLKSMVLVFAGLLALQGLALALRSAAILMGRPLAAPPPASLAAPRHGAEG